MKEELNDEVNHPDWYTADPSGVECIDVVSVLPNDLGCAVKYVWRHGRKWNELQDLRKALWYLDHAMRSGVTASGLNALVATHCALIGSSFRQWSTTVSSVEDSWDGRDDDTMSGFFDSLRFLDVEGMRYHVILLIGECEAKGDGDADAAKGE